MSDVIDQLASLTQLRDIDELDIAVCRMAQRWLDLRLVAIHHVVEEGGSRRWLTAVQLDGPVCRAADDCRAGDELPALDARPLWQGCLASNEPVQLAGSVHQTVFPMADNRGGRAVMELHGAAPLDAGHHRLIASLLGFHQHLRGLMDDNERDSLTGLLNRKSFDEAFVRAAMATEEQMRLDADPTLAHEDRRAPHQSALHWLAVVDIDHFKRVNDQFGHLIGDEVLLLVAQLMRQTFRHGDRIYRFGGEEFVVLLRCPHTQAARSAFERLRNRIAQHDFPQVGQLTISIGYTAIDADDTPSVAFERADLAVYNAKSEGRNRTVAHADLVVAPSADAPRGELEFF